MPQRPPARPRYVAFAMLAWGSITLAACTSSAGTHAFSTAGMWRKGADSCAASAKPRLPKDSRLDSVVVTAPCGAWAVGTSFRFRVSALIERWNGTSWNQVQLRGTPGDSRLTAVGAGSPADVWAVGASHDMTSHGARTLIEHWNGSTWSVTPSPDPNQQPGNAILTSVSVRSPRDAWAAGYYAPSDGANDRTLIEHWNGGSWRIVPSPNAREPQVSSVLAGISVAPDGTAWAVGSFYTNPPTGGTTIRSLIERWDGHSWRIWPSPDTGQSGLESVTASSPAGTWAVGWSRHGNSNRPEIARWTGHAWHLVPCPDLGTPGLSELVSVTATATRALAVGMYHGQGISRALALAWNGTTWIVLPVGDLAGPPGASFTLSSAGGLGFGPPWMVGYSDLGTTEQAIAVRG
jgi:hypothetical protein